MHEQICGQRQVFGESRVYYLDQPKPAFKPNLLLYDWGTIISQLLRNNPDGKSRHISTMYLEFENNGGALVSTPTPARDEGKSYYDSLSGSGTRDYLRVPIVATQLEASDETLFPAGNQPTFFAQAQGTTGVHGKAFSAAQQSRVYGAALVATPDSSDDSQDLVFARIYYTTSAEQLIKSASVQIGVDWRVTFN